MRIPSYQDLIRRVTLIFSDAAHCLSIVGTTALVSPSVVNGLIRLARAQGHCVRLGTYCVPTWISYALSRQLPPYVLSLAWLQLGFSAIGLMGRAQNLSRTALDHLCYTLSNCCRLGASVATIAIAYNATRRLRPTGNACRRLSARAVAVMRVVLAGTFLSATLPFALHPSPQREVLSIQVRMWIIGGVLQLVVVLVYDALTLCAVWCVLYYLLTALNQVDCCVGMLDSSRNDSFSTFSSAPLQSTEPLHALPLHGGPTAIMGPAGVIPRVDQFSACRGTSGIPIQPTPLSLDALLADAQVGARAKLNAPPGRHRFPACGFAAALPRTGRPCHSSFPPCDCRSRIKTTRKGARQQGGVNASAAASGLSDWRGLESLSPLAALRDQVNLARRSGG